MRVALLSSLESIDTDGQALRAFERIGGRSILRRQVDFALSQGCERITCLAEGMAPELLEMQHICEKAGASFHPVRDARPLSGLVKSDDRLLVIGDGVIFDQTAAANAIGEGRKILTFPADIAVPAGFERLDRERAWAGIMLVGGSLVERLADMPSDIDPVSSLLRLALQTGTVSSEIDPVVLSGGEWAIINAPEKSEKYEEKWLSRAVSPASFAAPFHAASDYAALSVLKRHLEPKKAVRALGGISAALLVASGVAGWMGYAIAGLGSLLFAGVFGRFSSTLAGIVREGAPSSGAPKWLGAAFPLLLDGLIVALATASVPGSKCIGVFFAVTILLGLMRLAAAQTDEKTGQAVSDFFEERGLIIAILIAGSLLGNIIIVPQLLALLTLGYLVVKTQRSRLTQA